MSEEKKRIQLPYNWTPREYQKNAWSALQKLPIRSELINRAVMVWPRRHGKDDVCLHHNACSAYERVGNYWYMLPEYNQCRKAIWDAVNPHTGKKRIDEAFPQEIRANTLQQEMKIIFKNGSSWQLMGSDNYDALVGSPPVGLTFSEYGLSNPTSWGYLRPILLENKGWAIFNSTPRGKNHFYKMFEYAKTDENWFAELLTVDNTGLFTEEDLLRELRELQSEHGEDYGRALWLQEYFCSFDAAIPGAIWADSLMQLEGRNGLTNVPHTEGYPVFTAWDLGRSDMTSVWFFQVVGTQDNFSLNIIDYYADNFKEVEDFSQMLRDKVKERGFKMGKNWLPHDAFSIKMGMGGKSVIQQFIDCRNQILRESHIDIGKFDRVPDLGREEGIQAARKTFHYAKFDKTHCEDGFDHLKSYHRKYDNEKKVFSLTPEHDEHSHPADAWRYLSLVWQTSKAEQVVMTQMEKFNAGNVVNVPFGDLMRDHFKKKRQDRAKNY